MRNPKRYSWLFAIFLAGCVGVPDASLDELPARNVSECQQADLDKIGSVEVAIAIDTSTSTRDPSDFDIDGDGRVSGVAYGRADDPGDSILAAQVAAVRSLLRNVSGGEARFSIITYAGRDEFPSVEASNWLTVPADGWVLIRLTSDIKKLESVLNGVLERGSNGMTDFVSGMQFALRTLVEDEDVEGGAPTRKHVLFMADSPTPLIAGPNNTLLHRDRPMKYAAQRAIEHQVRFSTFGLGRAARVAPPHALSQIAGATAGRYHAVEDPTKLHCQLLSALTP